VKPKLEESALSQPVQNHETGGISTKLKTQYYKGRIIEHAFWMKKEGYAENTITRRIRLLTTLAKRGANLLDPESVKVTIAKQQKWSLKTKELAVEAYSCFLKMVGGIWKPPKYKAPKTLPFIPTEKELDQLIAGVNKKTAVFLQLLKETGARSGETWMLKWVDFDLENKTVRITPEKGGNPRSLRMSDRLLAMINSLTKDQAEVFKGSIKHFRRTFRSQRKRIAYKLKNERIAEITFHTFRHWKATMEYAKTKNILHVMQMLGHKNIQNTLVYTHLINLENDEFHTDVADSVEKACKLIEAGFEYVTGEYNNGGKIFRKRK
jgi:integrase